MNRYCTVFICMLISGAVAAQSADTLRQGGWEFSADLNAYFMKEDFSLLPVFRADKDWLHLEARYNYEDVNTFSVWGGFNFSGGNKFEYAFTPMAGFVFGESTGLAPGLEMTLAWKDVELYSESEYFVDPGESGNNFYYMWTDISWSPVDWFWFGISGQRTRIYDTGLDIQRGILAGGGSGVWEINSYFYNPFSDDFYMIGALSVYF